MPKARGGDDIWENLISACTNCNNKKGDRTPEEARMPLLYRPFKPNHVMFIKNVVGKLDEKWKPYLYLSWFSAKNITAIIIIFRRHFLIFIKFYAEKKNSKRNETNR